MFLVSFQPSLFPEGQGWTVSPSLPHLLPSSPHWPHITSAQPEAADRHPCCCHPPLLPPAPLPSSHLSAAPVLRAEGAHSRVAAHLFPKGWYGWQAHKGGIRTQLRGRMASLHLLVFTSPCFGLHCCSWSLINLVSLWATSLWAQPAFKPPSILLSLPTLLHVLREALLAESPPEVDNGPCAPLMSQHSHFTTGYQVWQAG